MCIIQQKKGPRRALMRFFMLAVYFPFFFVVAFAGFAPGSDEVVQLLRSWAILWQSPHFGNLAMMLLGCFSPWHNLQSGTILCLSWWQNAQVSALCFAFEALSILY